ncbi:fumarate hydratase [Caproiciproducens sp. CPB-2]|uniref:fumarate hydratase n=1 Tax=Caproiciproducens sp. CPB-2 TaxID=3030017 RepID=UPI0023DAFCD6|nr:fumarate hydratase [Caproiciproducens sp. CPB-2]MDF1495779.1 fumarate hydratase [Caproiciproducens sp. CPB-2]
MREIDVSQITEAIKKLFIDANRVLPEDLENCISAASEKETSPIGKAVLCDLCENMNAARELEIPICQDTGMAVVFVEIGQEVHLTGGSFEDAVNEGVRQGYLEGRLRCSVSADPIRRGNTGDNTPAVIHLRLVPGDKLAITAAPKGFGSENMSRIKMFTPSASTDDIVGFVAETVRIAGGNPCPPVVLGVGIGGDFEKCALLAKQALCRPVSQRNSDPFYAGLEQRMLERVNELNVGPQGFGGLTTALAVNIEQFPTHIAGLPVAVNVGCHVTRHKKITI